MVYRIYRLVPLIRYSADMKFVPFYWPDGISTSKEGLLSSLIFDNCKQQNCQKVRAFVVLSFKEKFVHMKLLILCNSRLWLMCGLSAVYHFTFAHTVLWRTLVIGAEFSFWLCLLEVQPRCSVALLHHVLQCCVLCNVCVKDLRLCFYWFSSCSLSLMIALMMLMVVLVLLMMIFVCLYVTEICHFCKNEHPFACVCLFYTFYAYFHI